MTITCANLEDIFKDEDGVMALKPDLIDHFRGRLEAINRDTTLSSEGKVAATDEVIKNVTVAKKKAGVQAIETAVKDLEIHRMVKDAIDKGVDPLEAFYALIDRSDNVFHGSRDGAKARRDVLVTEQYNMLSQSLAKRDLLPYIKGNRDVFVEKATRGLVDKLSDDDIIKTYGVDQGDIDVSKMYTQAMATSLEQLRAAGIDVSAREGYLGRQTYSREKIDADPIAFRKAMIDNIDWEMTNKDIARLRAEGDADGLAIALDDFFRTFELDEATINKKRIGGGAIKYGKQRKIIYKVGSSVEMMKQFGYADTLFDNIIGTVDDVAKRVAIHEKLGHNSGEAVKRMLDRYVPSNSHAKAMALYDKYMGHTPNGEVWAQKLADTRAIGSLLMLTNSTFTAVATDLPAAVAALVQTGAAKNVFEGTLVAARQYFANIAPSNRKMLAVELQSKLIHNQNAAHKYLMEGNKGKISSATSLLFKMNGLEYHTQMAGLSTAKVFADRMLYQVKNNMVDPKMQRMLETHGIGDAELKVLNKLEGLTFSAEKLRNVDMAGIDTPAHLTPERFKKQIEHKMIATLNDLGDIGTQTPSLKESVTLGAATDPNTMTGQVMRFGTQFMPTMFKGFNDITFLNKVGGYSKYGKTAVIGARIASVMTTGYAISILRDIIYDREMTAPEDIGVDDYARWIQLSGVTGMWGDAILGSIAYNGASMKDAFVGPTAGLLLDNTERVARKANKYVRGEDVSFSESDMKAAIKMIPFAGIPLIMGPLTHTIDMLGD